MGLMKDIELDRFAVGVEATISAKGLRAGPPQLKVFVSYSRTDSAFADEIEAGLEYDGDFDVLIDRHDIDGGEDCIGPPPVLCAC